MTHSQERAAFAANLDEAMKALGWSQTDLARRVGVSQSTVSDWLGRKGALPGSDVLIVLVSELNVSADWLLLGRGSRVGGLPPASEAHDDGARAMLANIRRAIDQEEKKWRDGRTRRRRR